MFPLERKVTVLYKWDESSMPGLCTTAAGSKNQAAELLASLRIFGNNDIMPLLMWIIFSPTEQFRQNQLHDSI